MPAFPTSRILQADAEAAVIHLDLCFAITLLTLLCIGILAPTGCCAQMSSGMQYADP